MRKIKLNLNVSVANNNKQSILKLALQAVQKCKALKLKLIISSWVISFMLLLTDNLSQAIIALCCFAFSSYLMKKNKSEVNKLIENLDKRMNRLINK